MIISLRIQCTYDYITYGCKQYWLYNACLHYAINNLFFVFISTKQLFISIPLNTIYQKTVQNVSYIFSKRTYSAEDKLNTLSHFTRAQGNIWEQYINCHIFARKMITHYLKVITMIFIIHFVLHLIWFDLHIWRGFG